MKEKQNIIKEHKKILKIIKKHNKNYYSQDNPTISDSEFDKIKIEALKLEKKHSFLKKNESVQNIVGAKPLNKFKKVKHLLPMLSLSNAFKETDMVDFLKIGLKGIIKSDKLVPVLKSIKPSDGQTLYSLIILARWFIKNKKISTDLSSTV